MDLIWLIPLLPGVGALVNGVVGIRYVSKRTAGLVANSTVAASLALALYAFWELLALPPVTAMGPDNVALVGTMLYTDYLIPFELASILLLVAMVGAIVLARRDL